jgi:hypothetical protein
MSSIIVKPAVRHIEEDHYLVFDRLDLPGSGYSFKCDEHGTVDTTGFTDVQQQSWADAQDDDYSFGRVETYIRQWTDPAIGECYCGENVDIYPGEMTSTCDHCGRDYDWNGVLLAPRSQWGDSTGEHPADLNRMM